MNTKQTTENTLQVSLIQPTGSNVVSENITQLQQYAAQVPADTQMICLPECANMVEKNPEVSRPLWSVESDDPYLAACVDLAAARGCYVQIGSLVIQDTKSDKAFNRGYLIDPEGEIISRYDKCYLFDVSLPDGSSYHESNTFRAGTSPTMVDTPFGRLGLSICFDVRFPQLYQHFKANDVDVIFIPAAFTKPTGAAHWEVLLRARAIETQSFVIAAGQVGQHEDGRETYGHSMVINPWGEIVSQLTDDNGVLTTTIDLSEVDKVRTGMPLNAKAFEV